MPHDLDPLADPITPAQPARRRILSAQELARRLLAALDVPDMKNVVRLQLDMRPGCAAELRVEVLVTERMTIELETALRTFELEPKSPAEQPQEVRNAA